MIKKEKLNSDFDNVVYEFTHAHAKFYGEGVYEKDREIAQERFEELKRGVVREHFSNLGKKGNAKKGMGTNRELAKEMGKAQKGKKYAKK